MIFAIIIHQASLTDPQPVSAIGAAIGWVSDLLFGPLATIIAVMAVAWFGFAMLSGRFDIRHGLSVLLGCFLLFGARAIIEGFHATTANGSAPVSANVPAAPSFPRAAPQGNNTNNFDPYAGAAVLPSD